MGLTGTEVTIPNQTCQVMIKALDVLSSAVRPPKSVLRSAFGEGGRFWRRRVPLTEEDGPWTDSARTARLRTGDRTGRTSENACKHWLRTGSRVQRGERVPCRAVTRRRVPSSSKFRVQIR